MSEPGIRLGDPFPSPVVWGFFMTPVGSFLFNAAALGLERPEMHVQTCFQKSLACSRLEAFFLFVFFLLPPCSYGLEGLQL